jgi:DNA-binding beta-propeller fold protein YncE
MKYKSGFPLSLTQSLVLATVLALAFGSAQAYEKSFLGNLNTIVVGPSTVPGNGDVNPYGVARVPVTSGRLTEGNFLVSNFNNSSNQQGTGATIVEITPGKHDTGTVTLFAQLSPTLKGCPGGVGLTTALVALRSGFVVVGSLPTNAGNPTTAEAGCLIVLDSYGNVVKTFSGNGINGPWDMAAVDGGRFVALFVTNVLNDTVKETSVDVGSTPPTPLVVVNKGTVLRLLLKFDYGEKPELRETTVIGSGFTERLDPAALVIGPTGVAFDYDRGVLYVADTLNNRIAAIDGALFRFDSAKTGRTVTKNGSLNGPLGLIVVHDGHIITANGGDGNLVETKPDGKQIATKLVDSSGSPAGAGALFGLIAVHDAIYFVDDATNNFDLLY